MSVSPSVQSLSAASLNGTNDITSASFNSSTSTTFTFNNLSATTHLATFSTLSSSQSASGPIYNATSIFSASISLISTTTSSGPTNHLYLHTSESTEYLMTYTSKFPNISPSLWIEPPPPTDNPVLEGTILTSEALKSVTSTSAATSIPNESLASSNMPVIIPSQNKAINIQTTTTGTSISKNTSSTAGLSNVAVISLTTGVVTVVCAVIGFAIFVVRRRTRRGEVNTGDPPAPELHTIAIPPEKQTCETSPLHSDGYQDTISPARSSASQPSQYELYPQNTVLSDTGIHGLILGDCTSNHSETVNPIKTISQLLTEKEQIYGTILSPSSFGLSSRGGNEKAGLMCKIDDARMLEVQSEKRSAIFNQFTGIKQAASGSKDVATRERIPTLSTPPETWTVNEVVQWLQATGFSSELSRIFECAQIDGATLVSLSAEDMREQLSIEPLGLRLSVVDAIQKIEGLGIHQTGETVLDAPPAYEDVEFSHRTSPQKHQGDSSQEYTTP